MPHRATAASVSASEAGNRLVQSARAKPASTSSNGRAGASSLDEQRPDDRGVEGDRDRYAQAEGLDQDDVREGERSGDDHDDQRGRCHDPAVPLEAARATASVLSPVLSQTSFMRLSRKTS